MEIVEQEVVDLETVDLEAVDREVVVTWSSDSISSLTRICGNLEN
jgi:hypothetical protein